MTSAITPASTITVCTHHHQSRNLLLSLLHPVTPHISGIAILHLNPMLGWLCPPYEGSSLLHVYDPMPLVAMEAKVIMTQHPPLTGHHSHPSLPSLASTMPSLSVHLLLIAGCHKHSCCQPRRCWSITQIRSTAIDKYRCGRVQPTNRGKENT